MVDIHEGDCRQILATLPDEAVDCCVTSPPYWGLRDYGHGDQLGLEATPEEYVARMVEVFREVRRVLKPAGTLWLNLGDSYNAYNGNAGPGSGFSRGAACDTQRPKLESGHGLRTKGLKPKDLVGIPWMVAFALRADGWFLRQDIIWHKPNPMPESVQDRCTKSHEYIFLFSKSERYHYDADAIAERTVDENETRNKRSVWTVSVKRYKGAHFATFPIDLILPCVLAGCPEGGTLLDPFLGSGTTAEAALRNGCNVIGIELNPEYVKLARKRLEQKTIF